MRVLRTVAVLLSALVVGGCGGLTAEGPVQPGLEVGTEQAPNANLRYVFPGPGVGDDPEDIVSGFLRAGAASDGLYDNARQFLTISVAEQWNPDATLVLLADDTPPTVTVVDDTHVRITATPSGVVAADGRYTPAAPDAEVSATFTLTDASDEWRISELPEDFGRWIQRGDVSRLVQPYDLTYISTSRRDTVPDVRWFPLDKLATRLARAQLDPVPGFLQGAATTAVPEGARLLGDAVSVDRGLATVNLVGPRLDPDEATRQDLWAQFITTLNQDLSVSRVALSVNGTPVDLLGLEGPASSLADIRWPVPSSPELAPPVVRRGADVTVFDPTGAAVQAPAPTPVVEYPQVPAEYTHLALSPDGTELAAVDPGGDGLSRWRGDTRYEVPGFGTRVGSPSYDQRGYLWAGGVGEGADRLWTIAVSADPADPEASAATPVRADWLADRRVVESRAAAGGDRVAVLSTDLEDGDARIDLAGVVRGPEGRPERLADPMLLSPTISSAVGLTWVDSTDVATIARVGSGAPAPTVLGVGRDVRQLTPVDDAVAVATTGGERDLYVVTSDGLLFARGSPGWVNSGPADDLAVAGS